jgi:hypothetical protein
VDETGVVEEIDGFGDLVDYVLLVPLLEVGRLAVLANQGMQINVHMLEHQIDVLIVFRPNGALQAYDITVPQLPQEHDLPIGSLRISGVRKSIEIFLERLDCLGLTIYHLPNMPVGSTADLLHDLVAL